MIESIEEFTAGDDAGLLEWLERALGLIEPSLPAPVIVCTKSTLEKLKEILPTRLASIGPPTLEGIPVHTEETPEGARAAAISFGAGGDDVLLLEDPTEC